MRVSVVLIFCAIAGARAEFSTVVTASNSFAKDLYFQLSHKDNAQNILFSPLSLSIGMSMVYNGAQERTERQIKRNMFFDIAADDKETLNQKNYDIMQEFKKPSNQYTLSMANKLFGRREYDYHKDFQQVLSRTYGAPLEKIDLESDLEDVVQHINNWVAERTNMKVTNMVTKEDITANTSLALISACYFKGIWEESFPKQDIEERPFFKGGESIDVKMMYTEANLNYKAMPALKSNVLEIPYSGRMVSMFIVLPWNRTHGLEELEALLKTYSDINDIFRELRMTPVKVTLPIFSLEKSINLVDNLTNLGIDDIFSGKYAQLGEIASDAGIHISLAKHKTILNVTEQGRIDIEPFNRTTNASRSNEPLVRVNHPFLFFVRERREGAIFYMGRVVDPTADATRSAMASIVLILLALVMSYA